MSDEGTLPVVEPPDPPPEREATVHGVVLAAGSSDRYGSGNKLLASVGGKPVVRRAVGTLRESTLDGVTVVVGYQAERVADAVADLNVAVRRNEDFDEGQGTSVATGTEAAGERGADAVLLALGDMPWLEAGTVDALVAAYECGIGTALAAAFEGTRGNPVLFDGRHFEALAELTGETGGRALLLGGADAVAVETGDPGVRRDVDEPGDL